MIVIENYDFVVQLFMLGFSIGLIFSFSMFIIYAIVNLFKRIVYSA